MIDYGYYQQEVYTNGFTVIDNIYTDEEVVDLISIIDQVDKSNQTFRKNADLFAIRQFLKEVADVKPIIFNGKLEQLIENIFGSGYFVVKSIYFDKPERSNWFVTWHQDLTISVDKKVDLPGYTSWTSKHNQFAVQPPIEILEDNFTIRIHLDDTNEDNGALKVLPGSHLKSIYRPENIDWSIENEAVCNVKRGGVMIMRPLLMHASDRTVNEQKRRVMHIEFSRAELSGEISWSELSIIN
ncbi:phytanoyl-CoA dioxygenase family protein [Mucilaginibacter sp. BT774]|uniref:phytanoyl-CoA dioxygenase family protein n=1 Tax=Mucilaginibacter sp. BT774 TaxID=3062276 RepID=UPI002674E5FA|nr:phytanoyl-CoA dioxygenase family protein [Mucilaginibacter sp. BT774]MDO3626328.1 phytanoyl-CoA dioxygenase family protein [Mucilaginibacter sp. BT774]